MSIIGKAIDKLNHAKQQNDEVVGIANDGHVNNTSQNSQISELQLKFNIETLSAAGIVSPNEHAPYLADEFRRIKRPLLNNAFGSSSELVESGNVIKLLAGRR